MVYIAVIILTNPLHPIDPKTGDYTDGYHDPTEEIKN